MESNYFEYKNNFVKYKDIKSKLLIGDKNINLNPKVTIAIPTYKRAHLIEKALESSINQVKFNDYEIIIVDNEDSKYENETEELIKSYKNSNISYYKNEKNLGMFGNWNRCIELARGEYITILNDDDWLEENFLYEVSREFKDEKAIYTLYIKQDFRKNNFQKKNVFRNIYDMLKRIKKTRKLNIIDFFYGNRSAGSLGIVFKRKNLIQLGGYNENYFPSADYFFHVYYCKQYGAKLLKKELANYRIQENESMKLEVAGKWPEQTYLFRKYLIKNFLNHKKLFFLNKIITENMKKKINFNWKLNLLYEKKIIKSRYILMIHIKEIIKNIFY
jgi:glycosyltransferase involved in cell wall biosynthesis